MPGWYRWWWWWWWCTDEDEDEDMVVVVRMRMRNYYVCWEESCWGVSCVYVRVCACVRVQSLISALLCICYKAEMDMLNV